VELIHVTVAEMMNNGDNLANRHRPACEMGVTVTNRSLHHLCRLLFALQLWTVN